MSNDPILNSVLSKCYVKYTAGVEEHGGKGLGSADLSLLTYLKMLQEEQIDQLMYIEAAIQDIEGSK